MLKKIKIIDLNGKEVIYPIELHDGLDIKPFIEYILNDEVSGNDIDLSCEWSIVKEEEK